MCWVLDGIIKRKSIHVLGLEIKLRNSGRRNQVNMLQLPYDKIIAFLSVDETESSLSLEQNSCFRKATAYGISVATHILQILNSVSKCRFEL